MATRLLPRSVVLTLAERATREIATTCPPSQSAIKE